MYNNNKMKPDGIIETMKQFHLDACRMDVYIDGILCNKDTKDIENFINNKFKNSKNIFFLLTQTFLADFYIKEFKKKIECEESLLDNGNYIVKMYTDSNTVNIEKDFKLIYFDLDDSYYLLDFCTLEITIYLDNMSIVYIWNYDNSEDLINICTN